MQQDGTVWDIVAQLSYNIQHRDKLCVHLLFILEQN